MIWWSGACRGAGWSLWRAAVGKRGGRVESCTPLSCHAIWMQHTPQPLPLGCLSWAGACKLPHERPLSRCSSAYRCYRNATPEPLLAVMSRVCIPLGCQCLVPSPEHGSTQVLSWILQFSLLGISLTIIRIGVFSRLPDAGAPEETPERPEQEGGPADNGFQHSEPARHRGASSVNASPLVRCRLATCRPELATRDRPLLQPETRKRDLPDIPCRPMQ